MTFRRLVATTAIALLLTACTADDPPAPRPGGSSSSPTEQQIPDSLRPDYDRQAAWEIVSQLGKEIAVYLVDGAGTPDVVRTGDTLQLVGESLAEPLDVYTLSPNEAHFVINGVEYGEGSRHTSWCV